MFDRKGYVGQSMSVRAKNAYDNGLISKAKIKKSDLEDAGIDLPVNFIKFLMPGIIKPAEWHHTGKHYNETDFYDLEDIKEQLQKRDIESLLEAYKEEQAEKKLEREKESKQKGYYAYVKYGEWEGSRKHPKLVEYYDYVFIKGKWAYISGEQKKKIDGKNFKIIKTYKIKPRKMDTKIRNGIFKKLGIK